MIRWCPAYWTGSPSMRVLHFQFEVIWLLRRSGEMS